MVSFWNVFVNVMRFHRFMLKLVIYNGSLFNKSYRLSHHY